MLLPNGPTISFTDPKQVDIVQAEEGLSEQAEIHITSQKESNGTFARVIYSIMINLKVITQFHNTLKSSQT